MRRVAIVTGSGRGIGKAYARALADNGHRVVIADINNATATETAAELVNGGAEAVPVTVDVADPDSVDAMVQATVAEFGTVDILVNNAALFGADIEFSPARWDPLEGSMDQYHRAMSVNVDSIVHCSRAVAPIMKEKCWGRIVNQSSAAVYDNVGSLYSLTKLAVVAVTRMYALALAKSGVTVNAVSPGMTVTEAILNRYPTEKEGQDYIAEFTVQNVPMARPAEVEDIANVLVFLVSDAASYVTAQNISVDGGWSNRL